MNKITWIPHVSQMGGFTLGAEKAFGYPPEFISSANGFEDKDIYLRKFMPDLEYRILKKDDFTFKQKVNLVVSNPPCSGLSGLTPNNTSQEKKQEMNDYMIDCTRQSICCYDPDVIIGENAAFLFTKKGEGVLQNLIYLAQEYNYSVSLYKTNTELHGIPQSRLRTFYFLWKNSNSPVLYGIRKERKDLKNFLMEIPETAKNQNILTNAKITDNFIYKFLQSKNIDIRDSLIKLKSKQKNILQYIIEKNLFDELIDFYKGSEEEKKAIYIKNKKSIGQNIWNDYPKIWEDVINGIIGKNMNRTLHPVYERSLNIRECLHLMGFPHNYECNNPNDFKFIGKNVPVYTACDMVLFGKEFLEGRLEIEESRFNKFDNTIEKNEQNSLMDNW